MCLTVLCCAVLCFAVLYCTLLFSRVLKFSVCYSTVLCCSVLCFNVPSCALLCSALQYCTVFYSGILYCTVLYCTVLYCAVLCCTVLCCTVLCCILLCSLVSFWPGYFSCYGDSPHAGLSGDRIPLLAFFPHPCRPDLLPEDPPSQPVPGLFPSAVRNGRCLAFTTHRYLVPRLKKE